jgi:hypothetical protein
MYVPSGIHTDDVVIKNVRHIHNRPLVNVQSIIFQLCFAKSLFPAYCDHDLNIPSQRIPDKELVQFPRFFVPIDLIS